MVVDAEGALRGFKFENLVAQCGVQLDSFPLMHIGSWASVRGMVKLASGLPEG